MNQPAFQISGGQEIPQPPAQQPAADQSPFESPLSDAPAPPAPSAQPAQPDSQSASEPGSEPKASARSINALSAKVTMLSERLKAQESASAGLQSAFERVESSLGEMTKRAQPMLETLSAEMARQGAMLESLKTESESAMDLHGQRVNEFEQRISTVLREMRELVAGKIESYDIGMTDRLEAARTTLADQLATFEERVEDLVRRFAADAIPEEMRATIDELSSRFVYAETALAATRSSVEFLRGEVGGLTMTVRKLGPGQSAP